MRFESLQKAWASKPKWANQATLKADLSPEGAVESGFVLQPLSYRANTPSLKTLHSNHRITTHGTEMLFHTKRRITKKKFELLSTKAKLWLLTVLHSVHYQCVNLIVCAHVCVPSNFILHSFTLLLLDTMWRQYGPVTTQDNGLV